MTMASDFTQGSIPKHLLRMAVPIAIGMLIQTLYYLVDLYFIGSLGDVALAGASAAGALVYAGIALTQALSIGTVTLIAHAIGRKDAEDANLVFNQSLMLATVFGLGVLVGGYLVAEFFLGLIISDEAALSEGLSYLYWYIPSMGMQFGLVTITASMRAAGIIRPALITQIITVALNIVFAWVLVHGYFTFLPAGVAGVGLATTLSVGAGMLFIWIVFSRDKRLMTVSFPLWAPCKSALTRILVIGGPSSTEFIMLFIYTSITYWVIQIFGSVEQAGYGLGSRVMQAIFMPALAVAFAAPSIAGQNFGAKLASRVKDTYRWAVYFNAGLMCLLTLMCLFKAHWFVIWFSDDVAVIKSAAEFLSINAWSFVPAGYVFVSAGIFQALGNTWPSLVSSTVKVVAFSITSIWLVARGNLLIGDVWWALVTIAFVQGVLCYFFIKRLMERRLETLSSFEAAIN